jgi:hypothetical protein
MTGRTRGLDPHTVVVAGGRRGIDERKQNTLAPLVRCCYITVDSATTAVQNGACTYLCISKQMHYKTPFSHNGYMKILDFF